MVTREAIDTEPRQQGSPVLKRRRIGDKFRGAVVHFETRDQIDKDSGQPKLKANGKQARELVVHLLTLKSTMPVARKDDEWVPTEGEQCRVILKGGAWGRWIEAEKAIEGNKVCRGDVVELATTHADIYVKEGTTVATGLTDDAIIDDHRRRGRSVGYRGSLTISPATDEDMVARCRAAYDAMRSGAAAAARQPIEDEEPW